MTVSPELGQEVAEDMLAILARQDEDGSYHYSNEEAFDAMVSLILTSGMDLAKLPPALDGIMTRFFDVLNLDGSAGSKEVASKVNAHFKANPINPELAKELSRFGTEVQRKSTTALNDGLAQAAEMIGGAQAKTAPTDTGPRGPNPMVALRASQKKDKGD